MRAWFGRSERHPGLSWKHMSLAPCFTLTAGPPDTVDIRRYGQGSVFFPGGLGHQSSPAMPVRFLLSSVTKGHAI
ncbi:hypothetical protein BDZ85DRAFT_257100 [Elsinoe ampelina]|uniref:Uncharacterized protein n=1 Tax=Elsinoe ampelina TaxID=302913 RepID=A0A6A6GN08_9PEZI|nr:hypothetical protein BDZ85DRAFT_257100 [Elsinoe ampelina]